MAMLTCPKCGRHFYGVGCPTCDYPAVPESDTQACSRRWGGAIALTVGIACSLPGFLRSGPPGERALVFVFAGMFLLAGVQLLTNARGRLAWLIGAAIVAGFSVMGFTAAFGPGKISGGIPFLPTALNQEIGRFAFGSGGAIAALMALSGFWRAVKPAPPQA